MVISPRSFDLVHDHLRKLAYTGPVGLSCDDTKLSPAFQPYWDQDAGCYFILGSSADPIQIPDIDSFKALVEGADVIKATKVCDSYKAHTQ